MFLKLNSKGLYQNSGKEKESCCLVFPSSTKLVNLGTFTLYSSHEGKEIYKKCLMQVQSCCFANLNLLLFCRSRCLHCQRCLSSLLSSFQGNVKVEGRSVLYFKSKIGSIFQWKVRKKVIIVI